MAVSNLDINRAVRRVLVKHWIDLGRLSVRSTGTTVYIYGRLQRLPGAEGELTGPIVEAMFQELKRIKAIGRINAHLENWTDADGLWRPLEAGSERSVTIVEAAERGPGRKFKQAGS